MKLKFYWQLKWSMCKRQLLENVILRNILSKHKQEIIIVKIPLWIDREWFQVHFALMWRDKCLSILPVKLPQNTDMWYRSQCTGKKIENPPFESLNISISIKMSYYSLYMVQSRRLSKLAKVVQFLTKLLSVSCCANLIVPSCTKRTLLFYPRFDLNF